MKIADLKTYVVGNPPPHHGGRNWVFLKLITNDGIEGFGEAYGVPFHPHTVTRLLEDMGERFVIGSNPFQIEKLCRLLYSSGYGQHPDLTKMGVISAFEMACWDIIGKALNQPIYNLLGGQYHEKLRAYTYLYEAPGDTVDRIAVHTTPDLAATRAAAYVQQGFTAIKLDPIRHLMSPLDPRDLSLEALENAEAVVRSVREAVGSRCDILIGTHGQMTTHSAIRLARRLEKYDPLWFEEPVPPENVKEMARVAQATSIPIATGERLSTVYEFAELLEKQAAAILQMALGRVGGILEAKTIAGMAEAHYAQIAPHLYCGPIEGAANIQLDTCSPNFLIQESIETWGGFHAEILKEPIQWQDGYIIPPTKPGLGVELDEEVAARHPYIEIEPGTWHW
ncbi:MAG: mandelate racemase/muconate lactonizing enzyme family protein [Nitrospinota bacterium]|nr:MAG: mandelate racemase/muconate lactonizing enzyme family protein [Nitrospinota bacterium]